jgi:hypothetical protein
MPLSKTRGYVRTAAICASLLITIALFRSVVWLSGADELPGVNIFPIIAF